MLLGVFTNDPEGDKPNKSVYVFSVNQKVITWRNFLIVIPPPSASIPKSDLPPLPGNFKSDPPENDPSKKVIIVGASIGTVSAVLTLFVASKIAYKRIKKNRKEEGVPLITENF